MRRLLGEPAFRRLWLAAFCSETAEWMLQVALPVFVYLRTGSASSTAVLMVLGLLPAVVVSPVAGLLADRCDRRLVACLVCAGQAVVAVPLLLVPDAATLVPVYAVMALQAGLAALFEPVRNALVPQLVGPEHVTGANALLGVNANLARLAGAGAGGALLGLGGLPAVLAAYLAALAVASALLSRPFRGTSAPPPAEREPAIRAWLDGLREFRRIRSLRRTAVVLAFMATAQGMFLVLFVLFVTGRLGGGESEVGLLRGVQAIGGLAAGALLTACARKLVPAALLGWGLLAFGLCSAVIWNAPQVSTAIGVYVVLFAAVGMPGVVAGAGLLSILQTVTVEQLTGRVLSTAFAGIATGTAVGMLLAGSLVGVLGVGWLLNVQAALHVMAGTVALAGYRGRRAAPVRHQRPARDPSGQRPARRADPAGGGGRLAARGR